MAEMIVRLAAGAALVVAGVATVPAAAVPVPLPAVVGDTRPVLAETGAVGLPDSANDTSGSGDVWGTSGGYLVAGPSRTWWLFGDTYGGVAGNQNLPVQSDSPPVNANYRVNTLAFTVNKSDADPTDGLAITGWALLDPAHAKEILPARRIPGVETSILPTGGVQIGSRLYVFYESLIRYDLNGGGGWQANYGAVAWTDDEGASFHRPLTALWPGTSGFAQATLASDGGYLYLFGTPTGRAGPVRLARVPTNSIMTQSAYQYWNGGGWSAAMSAARPVVAAPAGNVSVMFNRHAKRWLMMLDDASVGGIVMRTAKLLTGPWSPPTLVVAQSQYPSVHMGSIAERFSTGKDIWFTATIYDQYEVWWWHTSLAA
jgi:hypothetical protein